MWAALGAPAASEEERMAALAAARQAAAGSCSAAARELIALADREADLLSRCGSFMFEQHLVLWSPGRSGSCMS